MLIINALRAEKIESFRKKTFLFREKKKNNKGEKIWGIPKSTEVDEKLVQKREEPEKEINENKF